jgi:hypothetical protein
MPRSFTALERIAESSSDSNLHRCDYDKAIADFQRVLTRIGETRDPVLEAEWLLRISLAEARKSDARSARDHLQRWNDLERFVEPFFLRTIRQNVYTELAAHEDTPTITFRSLRREDAESWFQQEITRIALGRSVGVPRKPPKFSACQNRPSTGGNLR